MSPTSNVTNDRGTSFLVRIVREGERHGLNDCLTHDKTDPLVEFYDLTFANQRGFGERGQFVSSYYASTLLERDGGICLHGGVAKWSIDDDTMIRVRAFVRTTIA